MRAGERAELEAMRSLANAPSGDLVEARERRGALAIRSPRLPDVETNRILGLYDPAALDELAPFYNGKPYWVALDPDAGLDAELAARGFAPGYAWQKFERGVEPLTARTDLRIADAAKPEDFGRAFVGGYDMPAWTSAWVAALVGRAGWHCFVAYDAAEPVAAGALFEAGDAGWLGAAATLPSHRGRGAQGAILAARIERAAELGLRVLVTETGVPRDGQPGPSYRNILRSGFEPSYVRPNYASPSTGG